jgi:hypothetical protein
MARFHNYLKDKEDEFRKEKRKREKDEFPEEDPPPKLPDPKDMSITYISGRPFKIFVLLMLNHEILDHPPIIRISGNLRNELSVSLHLPEDYSIEFIPDVLNKPEHFDYGRYPQPDIYWFDIRDNDGKLIRQESERRMINFQTYTYFPVPDFYNQYLYSYNSFSTKMFM